MPLRGCSKVDKNLGGSLPSTVELKKSIADVPIGGLLEVVTNDVCAKEDIPTWCRFTKNEIVEFQELGDGWMRFVIRRTR